MIDLEILQRRVEILEKGFQEIIALIKKDDEGKKNMDDPHDCDGFDEDKCDGCGRVFYDDGHCPLCCDCGMYAPGSEECDFCEHSDECSAHAASL